MSDILNYSTISELLTGSKISIQRGRSSKLLPLIQVLTDAEVEFRKLAEVHRLHREGKAVPEKLRVVYEDYLYRMGLSFSPEDRAGLYSLFEDDITLQIVEEHLRDNYTVVLWENGGNYGLQLIERGKDAGMITGFGFVSKEFRNCGRVSLKDIELFNKL